MNKKQLPEEDVKSKFIAPSIKEAAWDIKKSI